MILYRYVSFSALMLLGGQQEGHLACNVLQQQFPLWTQPNLE